MIIPIVKGILSVLSLAAQVVIVFLLVILFSKGSFAQKIKTFFGKRGILFAAIVATTAFLGSMFFSNVAMYTPCLLCWYQRICIFPQVLLLWIAYIRKESQIVWYSIPLASIGAIISGYHWFIQLAPEAHSGPCSFDGVSCVGRYIYDYLNMTIAGMAFTAGIFIIVLLILHHKMPHKKRITK